MIRACSGLTALSMLLSLSACGGRDYPSLAIRPAERITGTAEPATPTPEPTTAPLPASADVTGPAASLVVQAQAAHQRFLSRRAETERLVSAARGTAVGSEAWSVASVALANLESARSDAMIALAELDERYAAQSIMAQSGGNPADAEALAAARERVIALVGDEDAVLTGLRGRLPG